MLASSTRRANLTFAFDPRRRPRKKASRSPPPSPSTGGSGLRTAGWVVGGAGIVAMVVGGTLGLVARSRYDEPQDCSDRVCNSQSSVDTRNGARSTGDVATVVFVAGAAATAVGIVLWVVAPSGRQVAASPGWRVGVTPGGLAAEGRF